MYRIMLYLIDYSPDIEYYPFIKWTVTFKDIKNIEWIPETFESCLNNTGMVHLYCQTFSKVCPILLTDSAPIFGERKPLFKKNNQRKTFLCIHFNNVVIMLVHTWLESKSKMKHKGWFRGVCDLLVVTRSGGNDGRQVHYPWGKMTGLYYVVSAKECCGKKRLEWTIS